MPPARQRRPDAGRQSLSSSHWRARRATARRGVVTATLGLAVATATALTLCVVVCLAPPPPTGSPGTGTAPAEERGQVRARFGMNLSRVTDWSTEWPFVDVFKASRPWMQNGKDIAFDARGNPLLKPGQSVDTLMFREIGGHYPAGTYVATWEGTGKVDMSRWDVRKVVRQQRGRIEAEVAPADGGLQLGVLESDPADPVRNVRVWLPGFEGARSPFHPLFVERLAPFGVVRFMDWQATNNSEQRTWDRRARPEDARYSTDAGVPVEVMVDLANALHADPWFCIPHQADDDYVRNFAKLVKGRLDPERKVYVEFSNEVWNWGFAQTRWAHERGKKAGLGDPEALRAYSERAVEVFALWEKEFGGHDRLVRVLAAQFANPWAGEQVLTWHDAYKHADALAVAPYFGYQHGDPKTAKETARLPVDKLLDALEEEVDGKNRELIVKNAALAGKYHVQLVAYEGGQHLAGFQGAENDQALTELFIAANRDPRMGRLYQKHLAHWAEAGGGLYVAFSNAARPSKWGSWGMLEYQDQPLDRAPKYRALVDFIERAGRARK